MSFNTLKERYIFRTMQQRLLERLFEYIARLQDQAKRCNFVNDTIEVYDKILENTKYCDLRDRAFREGLTFNDFIKLAFECEKREMLKNERNRLKECFRCGEVGHIQYDSICTARDKVCTECDTRGHVAKACTRKSGKRPTIQDTSLPELKKMKIEHKQKPAEDHQKFKEVKEGRKEERQEEVKHEFENGGEKKPTQKIIQEVIAKRTESMEKLEEKPKIVRKLEIVKPEKMVSFGNPKSSTIKPRQKKEENEILCRIGDVDAKVLISDDFSVNVMSSKFFETHRIKCSIYGNSPVNINGHSYTGVLETRIEKNGHAVSATFYFSDDIKEEKCVIISHVGKKLLQK